METIEYILNFCNNATFYDYTCICITVEMNQIRKYIINTFYKTILDGTITLCLSIIDDTILKINNNDIENIIENFHGLRENILYVLSFEKLIKDEQQIDRPILNDNDE